MKTLIKYLMGKEEVWTVSDKTRNVLVVVFMTTGCVAFIIILIALLHALTVGLIDIPPNVSEVMWRTLVTVLLALGPFVAHRLVSDTNTKNSVITRQVVRDSAQETQNKMVDGLGDALADKIIEKQKHSTEPDIIADKVADRVDNKDQ